jgi:hypothetical protein
MDKYHGIVESDLLATFNTTQFPIQSREGFLQRAAELASQFPSRIDFEKVLRQDSETTLAQLKQILEDSGLHVVACSSEFTLHSADPKVYNLIRDPSLEALCGCFADSSPAQHRTSDTAFSRLQPAGVSPPTSLRAKPVARLTPNTRVSKRTRSKLQEVTKLRRNVCHARDTEPSVIVDAHNSDSWRWTTSSQPAGTLGYHFAILRRSTVDGLTCTCTSRGSAEFLWAPN